MPRLLTALPLPPATLDALSDTMEGVEAARWQDEAQLHLTLTFLNEVAHEQVADLVASLARVAFAPFPVAVAGVGHFESKGRVTALWAGVRPCPPLATLQASVARAGDMAGVPHEARRFVPHVTLARLGAGAARGDPTPPAWLARHALLALPPFSVDRFALYHSEMSPVGSHYTLVEEFTA